MSEPFFKGGSIYGDFTSRRDLVMGFRVIVSPLLPMPSTDRDNARRIVRHGLREVLEWLGEPVGPEPYEECHMVVSRDTVFVSNHAFDKLKEKYDA